MRARIGGAIDLAALALLHRPKDRDAMRVAVDELRARGFTDYGIAQACGLSVEAVRELLGGREAS